MAALLTPLLIGSLGSVSGALGLENVSSLALGVTVLGLGAVALITRTLWDARMLLSISLVLFNAGALIAHVFTPNDPLVVLYFSDGNLAAAGYLVSVCLAAWVLATVLTALLVRPRATTAADIQVSKLRLVGLLFLTLGTVPAVLELISALRVVADGGYLSLYSREVNVGASGWRAVAGAFFVPGLLFLLGSGTLMRRGVMVVVMVMLAFVATKLALGSRSPAIMPLIALWFVVHYRIWPIPARLAVGVGAVLFLVVLPVIAVLRDEGGVVRLTPAVLAQTFANFANPALATLNETGASIMPTAYALNYIPGARDFGNGASYVNSLWTILPSTGGLNPAVAGDNVYANWLTRTVDPSLASIGGGFGFSPIAETYANFGVVGGVTGFFAIALAMQVLLTWFSNYRNAAHIVFSGVILSILLLWARGETVSFVRPLVWFVLVPAVYLVVQAYRRPQRNAELREETPAAG
ncbi:hypothetical protein GCM10010840_35300 [Deinococcus aerolatus]|uniref:Oligosaccharide repeat unit polymerase n=1 Tax=Deinococcus aerolatus TaxID=522487 RepID=A0ABQ2GFQ3_9DEIO|nr:O-antigen polysaccharide polymerase Wzy [Deinococcus aerolatus]GGL94231.1 hypothetical protein GCM10010840_35300 [Deinococcus aerolatus]